MVVEVQTIVTSTILPGIGKVSQIEDASDYCSLRKGIMNLQNYGGGGSFFF